MKRSSAAAQTAVAAAPRAGSRLGVARGALHLVVGQTIAMALGVVAIAVVGRRLGATAFGELYLVTSISTFALYFAEWGQIGFVTRTVAREPARAGDLLGAAVAFRIAAVGTLVLLLPTAMRLLGYGQRVAMLLSIVLVASFPLACSQVFSIIFRARDRMDLDAICNVCGGLIGALISVTAVFLTPRVEAVLVGMGISGLFALALYVMVLRRFLPMRPRISLAGLREILVGGVPFLALALAIAVQPYLDATLVFRLTQPRAVGWYGAAARMAGALVFPAGVLGTALFPTLSRLWASDPGRFHQALRSALRVVLALASLAACGTWLLAGTAIALLYGKAAFAPTIRILEVLAPFLGLVYINMVLGYALMACGRQRAFTAAKLCAVVLCVALEILLIPMFQARTGNGGIGVAAALGSAELLLLFAALLLLGRGAVDASVARDFAKALITCACTVAVGVALSALSPLLRIPVVLLTFAAVGFGSGLLRREDALLLRDAIRSRHRLPSAA
jgi:O-antigen/teichoic acid export membrane protein